MLELEKHKGSFRAEPMEQLDTGKHAIMHMSGKTVVSGMFVINCFLCEDFTGKLNQLEMLFFCRKVRQEQKMHACT